MIGLPLGRTGLMMRRLLLLLILAVSLSPGRLMHAAGDDLVLSFFGEFLDSLRQQAGIPALAAAIVGPNGVWWERAYGQQDIDRNVAARPDTPFALTGTTETHLAASVLRCAR